MSEMLTYLQVMKNMTAKMKAKCIETIVLEHGRTFIPSPCPRPKGIRRGKMKMCFMNSYHLAVEMNWTYVEGFAIASDIPIPLHHAWVVDQEGNVIETTWEDSAAEYYGIPLEFNFMERVMLETRRYGVLDPCSKIFQERYML